MNLQRIIDPFPVSEMPDKRKNRLLPSAYTEKKVYYMLRIHEPFSRLLRCQKRFSVYYSPEIFYSDV